MRVMTLTVSRKRPVVCRWRKPSRLPTERTRTRWGTAYRCPPLRPPDDGVDVLDIVHTGFLKRVLSLHQFRKALATTGGWLSQYSSGLKTPSRPIAAHAGKQVHGVQHAHMLQAQ
jgi:hypothetical protein